ERIAPLAFERVDDLRVAARAERRDDERLRLAAREHGRAVRARQDADLDADRAHRARIAAVDARLPRENAAADDLLLERLERALDLRGRIRRRVSGRELGDAGLLDLTDARIALLLLGDAVGLRQLLRAAADGRDERL